MPNDPVRSQLRRLPPQADHHLGRTRLSREVNSEYDSSNYGRYVDMNGDGQYTPGIDGLLGCYYGDEYRGPFGWVDQLFDSMMPDYNGDGTVSAEEAERAGIFVWVDRDKDGRVDDDERHRPSEVPDYITSREGRKVTRRLDFDRVSGKVRSTQNRPAPPPWWRDRLDATAADGWARAL